MGRGGGGAGRSVSAMGVRFGDVVIPTGGYVGAVRVTSVRGGVVSGVALNAPSGTLGSREATVGNRTTRFIKYKGEITGDRYKDSAAIGRYLRNLNK